MSTIQSSTPTPEMVSTLVTVLTPESFSQRLGPTYRPEEPRLLNYSTECKPFPGGPDRVNPYNLGKPNDDKGNYWSDSGQVTYIPDDTLPNDPGLGATRHFAYYRGVFATAPNWDAYRGTPNPDPTTRHKSYIEANGETLRHPIAQVRSQAMTSNDAIILWANGLITVAGTQTGHGSTDYPWLKLPANKIPIDLAVTSNNEMALVILYDVTKRVGQLAVIMLEGRYIPFHTFHQMGLPNQCSCSDMKLMGFIDISMNQPFRIAAASNGHWTGPSATNNLTMGQIDMGKEGNLKLLYSGAWGGVISKAAYCTIISRDENRLVVLDLTKLITYTRESWLSSLEAYNRTSAARTAGTWPESFESRPDLRPELAFFAAVDRPVSVICGHSVDRWSKDCYKFHVGLERGDIVIYDASHIMARATWEVKSDQIAELGRFFVGANPVHMAFSRRNEGGGNDFFPTGQKADGFNSSIYVACRADRKVVQFVSYGGKGLIYRMISDLRLEDPVNVAVCVRGYIVLVADYHGKQIVGFRVGNITDSRQNPPVVYAPAEGKADFEFSGALPIPGYPFAVTTENVN